MTSIDIMPFVKGFSGIHAHTLLKRVSKRIVNNQMLIILTMTPSDWQFRQHFQQLAAALRCRPCGPGCLTVSRPCLSSLYPLNIILLTAQLCHVEPASVTGLQAVGPSHTLLNRALPSWHILYLSKAAPWSQHASTSGPCPFDSLDDE